MEQPIDITFTQTDECDGQTESRVIVSPVKLVQFLLSERQAREALEKRLDALTEWAEMIEKKQPDTIIY